MKLTSLSISVLCLVAALWSDAQCSDQEERKDRHHQTKFIPAGSIVSFAGKVAPDEWLLCDGQQYSNQRYPELYEVIREQYVPPESWVIQANRHSELEKYFYVPDLRGRVIVGEDRGTDRVTTNNTLGASGGEETHLLTEAELPRHNHKMFDAISGTRTLKHTAILSGTNPNLIEFAFTEETGSNQLHNNMQPYQVLNYIINTGKSKKQHELNLHDEKINQLEKQIKELKISQQKSYPKWVVFNGSDGSVFCHSGVSSVTRKGNGWYTVNFLEPFSSKNYFFSLNSGNGDSSIGLNTTSAHHPDLQSEHNFTFHTFLTTTTSTTNPLVVSAIFYGNQ